MPPGGHLTMSGDSLGCYARGEGVTFSRSRAGMLLNILHCIGQLPPQNDLAPDVSKCQKPTTTKNCFKENTIHLYRDLYYIIYTFIKMHWPGNEGSKQTKMLALSTHLFPKIVRLYFPHNLSCVLIFFKNHLYKIIYCGLSLLMNFLKTSDSLIND